MGELKGERKNSKCRSQSKKAALENLRLRTISPPRDLRDRRYYTDSYQPNDPRPHIWGVVKVFVVQKEPDRHPTSHGRAAHFIACSIYEERDGWRRPLSDEGIRALAARLYERYSRIKIDLWGHPYYTNHYRYDAEGHCIDPRDGLYKQAYNWLGYAEKEWWRTVAADATARRFYMRWLQEEEFSDEDIERVASAEYRKTRKNALRDTEEPTQEGKKRRYYGRGATVLAENDNPLEAEAIARQPLQRCLDSLKPDDRDILLKSHVEGMSDGEIAEEKGSTKRAIAVKVWRLTKRLLKLYKEYGENGTGS